MVLINYLDEVMECTVSKLVDDTKVVWAGGQGCSSERPWQAGEMG